MRNNIYFSMSVCIGVSANYNLSVMSTLNIQEYLES